MNNVLTDGSYALIDTHVDAQSGDIALVKVNGDDATVKRIKKMDGFTEHLTRQLLRREE